MSKRSQGLGIQWTTGRAIAVFVGAGIFAMAFIAAVGLSMARRSATSLATRDARDVVETDARHVSPLLDSAVLANQPAAIAAVDKVVNQRVLSNRIVRVKVWDGSGRIVYSDDHSLIGSQFTLGAGETDALTGQTTEADLSDLNKPENRNERQFGKLLEVYVGVRTAQGTPLLYESYLRFDTVNSDAHHILVSFAPALFGGLIALFLVQIPLAIGLTHRVRDSEQNQRRLLLQAIESSDHERRRIAADLHDSVVQGLAGSSYALAALADELERGANPNVAGRLRDRSAELRQWVRELRTLIVSMAPPRLHDEGVAAALGDLTSTLPPRGIDVTLDVDDELSFDAASEALIWRGAQEAVRNIVAHSHATHADVSMHRVEEDRVRLVVHDNGRGFDADELVERQSAGHVGLRLLTDVVEQAGGTVSIDSEPGAGTTVTLEIRP